MAKLGIGNRLNRISRKTSIDTSDFKKVLVDPEELVPSEENFYSQENIEELADNMRLVGYLQPIIVGRVNGEDRVIAGHRRRLALIHNKLSGHEKFNKIECLMKEMTENMFMLTLLSANMFNRKLTDWEITEEARLFKEYIKKAKEEDGLKITGKMRDYIADAMGVSSTKMAQIDKINNSLCEEGKVALKNGDINFTTAYEASKLETENQKKVLENKHLLSKDVKELVEQEKRAKEDEQAAVENIQGQIEITDYQEVVPENEKYIREDEFIIGFYHNGMSEDEVRLVKEGKRKELIDLLQKSSHEFGMEDITEKGGNYERCSDKVVFTQTDTEAIEVDWFRLVYRLFLLVSTYRSDFIDVTELPDNKTEGVVIKDDEGVSKTNENVTNSAEIVSKHEESVCDQSKTVNTDKVQLMTKYAMDWFAKCDYSNTDFYLFQARRELWDNYEFKREHTFEPDYYNDHRTQPELPILRNNDQRKEFIDNYTTWPLWIGQKLTGERYYRYDLSDKVALVVKVSKKHTYESYKETRKIEYGAEEYYLLGIKTEWRQSKNKFVIDEKRTFYECKSSKSELVDYLKEFQKKGKI